MIIDYSNTKWERNEKVRKPVRAKVKNQWYLIIGFSIITYSDNGEQEICLYAIDRFWSDDPSLRLFEGYKRYTIKKIFCWCDELTLWEYYDGKDIAWEEFLINYHINNWNVDKCGHGITDKTTQDVRNLYEYYRGKLIPDMEQSSKIVPPYICIANINIETSYEKYLQYKKEHPYDELTLAWGKNPTRKEPYTPYEFAEKFANCYNVYETEKIRPLSLAESYIISAHSMAFDVAPLMVHDILYPKEGWQIKQLSNMAVKTSQKFHLLVFFAIATNIFGNKDSSLLFKMDKDEVESMLISAISYYNNTNKTKVILAV